EADTQEVEMFPIRRAGGLALALVLCLGSAVHAQCVRPLAAVGAVDPANGFPAYYIDSNGLALQPCLGLLFDPAVALPDPNLPVSFPANFPDEFFYFRGISDILVGTVKARLVLALEGAFVNGPVVLGDQIVFTRVRVRVSDLVAGATYRVTHPYGQLNVQ